MKYLKQFTFLILFSLAVLPASTLYAEEQKQATVNLNNMSEADRLKLAKYLIENKQADKAISAIIFKPFNQNVNIVSAQLLLADALFLSDKKPQAIKLLRDILSKQPENALARFKLAQMLFSTSNKVGAKHHFLILRAAVKDDESQRLVDAYLQKMAHKKNWFFNITGSYSPKANFNGGVVKDIYYCDDFGATPEAVNGWRTTFATLLGQDCDVGIVTTPDQKAQNGFVLDVTAAAGYGFKLDQNSSWTVKATSQIIKYPHTVPSLLILTANTGPTLNINKQVKLVFDASASYILSRQKLEKRNLALSGEITYIINPKLVATGYLSITKTDNYNDADLTGYTVKSQNNLRYSLDNTSFVSVKLGAQKGKFNHPNNGFTEISGGFGYYKDLVHGITVYSETNLALRHKNLEDIQDFNISAKLTKRDLNLWGFAPQLGVSYSNYNSTLNRFDKSGPAINIGITKSF